MILRFFRGIMFKPNFSSIKKLLATYPVNVSETFVYREVPRSEARSVSVFGLPETAVANLEKVFSRQLVLFGKAPKGSPLPVNFAEYAEAVYMIVGLGYIATSGVNGNKNLLEYYYQSVNESFIRHGDFTARLSARAIDDIAKHLAKIINIALVSFNLTDYPYYFTEFKKALRLILLSFEMFDDEDELLGEAKKLLELIVKY
jgi:hypothetical protein